MTGTALDWPTYAIPYQAHPGGPKITLPDVLTRDAFEQGFARQRRMSQAFGPWLVDQQLALTPAQYKLFKAFVGLRGGRSFSMPIFAGTDYEDAVVQIAQGSLKEQRSGSEWLVSLTLETMTDLAADGTPTAEWPASLPQQPLNDPYAQTAPDAVNREDFDGAMPAQFAPFLNAPEGLAFQWAMTPAQFETFKTFVKAMGPRTFSIPVFRDDDYVTASARFVKGAITATWSGADWLVSAQLETMDVLSISETEFALELLTAGSTESYEEILDDFHNAINVTFPAILP